MDAQLLGEVYIGMTRGQEVISIDFIEDLNEGNFKKIDSADLNIIQLSPEEIKQHESFIKKHDLFDW